MNGPQVEPVDPDAVLAWARRHLTLTPAQEEFLLAVFTERPADPRELRPTPIPEEHLQLYRDLAATYLRTAYSPRIVIDVDRGRPEWLDPELWDHLEEARLDAQRSRVWGRRWYGDDARPTGQADL